MTEYEYEEDDKSQLPGFVYLMDDGRDLKLGITRNIDNRLKTYITENPRLKCHDSFQAKSLKHAEKIEKELIDATSEHRTHGKEWCKHCDEVFAIWEEVSRKYAKRTYKQWLKKRSNNELDRALEIVLQDARKYFKEQDSLQDKWFQYADEDDVTFCDSEYFDGRLFSARQIVLKFCRDWMQENNAETVSWKGEDLMIVQRSRFDELQHIEREYFDFSAARKRVFDDCQKWMKKNKSKYAHWEGEKLAIIKHSEYEKKNKIIKKNRIIYICFWVIVLGILVSFGIALSLR